jgi:SAM-dependent methyltransferase
MSPFRVRASPGCSIGGDGEYSRPAMDPLGRARRSVGKLTRALRPGGSGRAKGDEELAFWRSRRDAEGRLTGQHYEHFFTSHFGLDREFYAGKKLLDIGCGPRGSLEWATTAEERVGLDPLAGAYREFGIDEQQMTYVEAPAERIPFEDGYFDVVSSFNSLDHVDDLLATIAEIKRVVKPGGTLLLLTDVNHDPTPTEPIEFSWDVVELFGPELAPAEVEHYEKSADGVYQSISAGVRYDHNDANRRYGVLSARFAKLTSLGKEHF